MGMGVLQPTTKSDSGGRSATQWPPHLPTAASVPCAKGLNQGKMPPKGLLCSHLSLSPPAEVLPTPPSLES